MKHMTRIAAAAATTALAATALVGTATTAEAAKAKSKTVTAQYHCVVMEGIEYDLALDITTNLPAKVKANKKVKPTNIKLGLVVPAELAGLAASIYSATEIGGDVAGNLLAKKNKIPMTGKLNAATIVPGEDVALTGKGKTKAFKIKKKGTYPVSAPKQLTFSPFIDGGEPVGLSIPCTLTKPAKLGSIKVTK